MLELENLHMTGGEHFMSFLALSYSSKEHFIHNLQFLFISKHTMCHTWLQKVDV